MKTYHVSIDAQMPFLKVDAADFDIDNCGRLVFLEDGRTVAVFSTWIWFAEADAPAE